MSGGSYNYLCFQLDSHGHLDLADLKAMRDRLQELAPGSRATQDTVRLYDTLAAVASVVDGDLTRVWYAVEWLDSGDYSIDQVEKALRKYNAGGAR